MHTASRIDTWLGLVMLGLGLVGLGLASQASRVYLSRMATHTATDEASCVYSVSLYEYVYLHKAAQKKRKKKTPKKNSCMPRTLDSSRLQSLSSFCWLRRTFLFHRSHLRSDHSMFSLCCHIPVDPEIMFTLYATIKARD